MPARWQGETESSSRWQVALVPDAWSLFESGEQECYEQVVADFAIQFTREYGAIYLSQASMQGAFDSCDHDNVVTSPGPGVVSLSEK